MKQQVVVIHGGQTFDSYEEYFAFLRDMQLDFAGSQKHFWKESLAGELGEGYELVFPRMPNALNAKYAEWELYFDKYVPFLRPGVIFIGHSLGGIFLAKYLSLHSMPVEVGGTILLAAPHDDHDREYSLADFTLPSSLSSLQRHGGRLCLFHSKDDPVVSYADVLKYHADVPDAELISFDDRGHFNTEQFPELVAKIKELSNVASYT